MFVPWGVYRHSTRICDPPLQRLFSYSIDFSESFDGGSSSLSVVRADMARPALVLVKIAVCYSPSFRLNPKLYPRLIHHSCKYRAAPLVSSIIPPFFVSGLLPAIADSPLHYMYTYIYVLPSSLSPAQPTISCTHVWNTRIVKSRTPQYFTMPDNL